MTRTKWIVTHALLLLTVLTIGLALLNIGPTTMTMFDDASTLRDPIIWQTRFPRLLLALLVGMALATTGTTYQTLLRNPLADPYILGVSGGAALGSTIGIVCGLPFIAVIGCAFGLSLATICGITALASPTRGFSTDRLLLTGVVCNAFAFALMMALQSILPPERAQQMIFLLMGTLTTTTPDVLWILAGIVIGGIGLLLRHSRALDALACGEETAAAVGVDLARTQRQIFILSSLIVGAAVAMSGLIGFVGLFVPHAVRLIVGTAHRHLLPASAYIGGLFLMCTDTIARTAFSAGDFQTELPVGVITALIGAPCFVWLLRRRVS